MLKIGAPPDKFGVLYRMVTYRNHGFTSRINSKGYYSLVPGLTVSQFFRDGMGPFNLAFSKFQNCAIVMERDYFANNQKKINDASAFQINLSAEFKISNMLMR